MLKAGPRLEQAIRNAGSDFLVAMLRMQLEMTSAVLVLTMPMTVMMVMVVMMTVARTITTARLAIMMVVMVIP